MEHFKRLLRIIIRSSAFRTLGNSDQSSIMSLTSFASSKDVFGDSVSTFCTVVESTASDGKLSLVPVRISDQAQEMRRR